MPPEPSPADEQPAFLARWLLDFGDESRVRLTLEERAEPEGAAEYPRVLELHGNPPPQYPALDDEEEQ